MIQLQKVTLNYRSWSFNALVFSPKNSDLKGLATITHGYTSHKGSLLNWASRLCEEGIACILLDIPGHYLGGFNEVSDLEEFKSFGHEICQVALEKLMENHKSQIQKNLPIFLCGHSLGALLSLKAVTEIQQKYPSHQTQVVGVGFGASFDQKTHLFETPFYKSTLQLRGQLVSEVISPEVIFPWINQEKADLNMKSTRIHLITGEDDIVVGKNGTEKLAEQLESHGNNVTIEKPKKLAHHQPELAAAHVKKFIIDQLRK